MSLIPPSSTFNVPSVIPDIPNGQNFRFMPPPPSQGQISVPSGSFEADDVDIDRQFGGQQSNSRVNTQVTVYHDSTEDNPTDVAEGCLVFVSRSLHYEQYGAPQVRAKSLSEMNRHLYLFRERDIYQNAESILSSWRWLGYADNVMPLTDSERSFQTSTVMAVSVAHTVTLPNIWIQPLLAESVACRGQGMYLWLLLVRRHVDDDDAASSTTNAQIRAVRNHLGPYPIEPGIEDRVFGVQGADPVDVATAEAIRRHCDSKKRSMPHGVVDVLKRQRMIEAHAWRDASDAPPPKNEYCWQFVPYCASTGAAPPEHLYINVNPDDLNGAKSGIRVGLALYVGRSGTNLNTKRGVDLSQELRRFLFPRKDSAEWKLTMSKLPQCEIHLRVGNNHVGE